MRLHVLADVAAALPDIPQRTEGGRSTTPRSPPTPADGDPAKPVGLGAFKFESYTPGNGNSFRAVRNDDYWRGPNGITGEDLPYLDAIEARRGRRHRRPLQRACARASSTSCTPRTPTRSASSSTTTASRSIVDEPLRRHGYIMLNVAEGPTIDPEGKNAASPLLNVHCRRALAHAIDRERLIEERGAGLVQPANGPFPPGSIGYLEDTGYPAFDLDQANEEMDQCLAELGTDHIEFTFNTTNDPFNVETEHARSSRCGHDAFGDKVKAKITPIEQGQYIGLALTGAFNVLRLAQPQRHRSRPAAAVVAERVGDPDRLAGAQLRSLQGRRHRRRPARSIKSNADPAARKAAAEAINRRFGEQVYNLWLELGAVGHHRRSRTSTASSATSCPTARKGIGLAFAGRHQMNQIWCDDGKCE